MKKVALITDGWKRMFTYAWPSGILQRINRTKEAVNLYIFNSTGNWSRDAGYNRAEYNIYNLPDLKDFDGIILELNNISSKDVLAEVTAKAKASGVPVVSIANEFEDFYYVGIDNHAAMYHMMAHLHERHGFWDFWLMMGPEDNYESNRRLDGLLDYAGQHGITIAQDRIWHGNFDFKGGCEGFEQMWKRHGRMPQAVICVNDNVAVAVCEKAAELGFHAPYNFSVTGFDNFDKAAFYMPSITTVGHVREEAASLAMDVLLRVWSGDEVPRYSYTGTELTCQESCGCAQGSSRNAREHLRNLIMNSVDKEEFDKEVLSMEAEMRRCDTVEEMMSCIPQCIPSLKCDAMYLVLDEHINDYKIEAEESIYLDMAPENSAFVVHGYPKNLKLTFAYENGRVHTEKKEIQGIFPMFDYDEAGQNFLFLPLHFGERSVGYLVIRNAIYLMKKYYLFQIINTLSSAMENLHKKEMLTYMNKRLKSLYIIDQLTGMYNRSGYRHVGERIFKMSQSTGKPLVILFVDLDRLKFINDNFGHDYGDRAIVTVAKALALHASEDAVSVRMGGDEFALMMEYTSKADVEILIARVRETLKEEQEAQQLPFPVVASIGYVVTDPKSDTSLETYVKWADEKMYEEKIRHKATRRD